MIQDHLEIKGLWEILGQVDLQGPWENLNKMLDHLDRQEQKGIKVKLDLKEIKVNLLQLEKVLLVKYLEIVSYT